MEGFGFSDASSAVRRRRNTARRPRIDSPLPYEYHDISSLSSTPPSDINLNGGFGESDEASNNGSYRGSNDLRLKGDDSRRCSEGVLSPAKWKNTKCLGNIGAVSDVGQTENKVKKVKLKVGGVTCTINTKSTSDGASAVGSSSTKSSHYPDSRQKSTEDNLDENRSYASYKESNLQGAPWRDIPRSGLDASQADKLRDRIPDISSKQADASEPVRKSKRVPKKRTLDGVLDDMGEDDDEIRYLEKVKRTKADIHYGVECEDEEAGSRKHQKISKVLKRDVQGLYGINVGDHGLSRYSKAGKTCKSSRAFEDMDYVEDEETGSDGEATMKKKKAKKELVDVVETPRKENTITTRQRALQSGKDISSTFVEFPNGLPPAPPKKQKEKLSEVEQQLKRAEALQRRRMQVEKANRESEAEAIRKILGQDSSRKKREDKVKKRQEQMALEKTANANMLTQDHVRWVLGPSGTVVTFPIEMGLPSIFDPKPCSYPRPREKCAGPSCTNSYKYRDSKSNLPLCSLQCYKAIHEKVESISAC